MVILSIAFNYRICDNTSEFKLSKWRITLNQWWFKEEITILLLEIGLYLLEAWRILNVSNEEFRYWTEYINVVKRKTKNK